MTFKLQLIPFSTVLLEKIIVTQLFKISPALMESEGSLLLSQEPATGPCPDPYESIYYLPTIFPQNPF
jgi:hypothetical protein